MNIEIRLWKINFIDKTLTEFVVNCANSEMSGYVGSLNGVSHVGSEIFGVGLWFEKGLKVGVGLKFHMDQNVHALT